MIPSRLARERENVDAFLCHLTGSGSHAPVRERESVRTSPPADSHPIADSHEPVRITSDANTGGNVTNDPSFSRSHDSREMTELATLVREIADELDRHPAGTFAVTGEQVRQHYRDLARRDLQGALASARHRYWQQCTGLVVLPLPSTDGDA